jgi:hypothetical protein
MSVMQTNPTPATDYVGLISLAVAVASLFVSIAAVVFAKRSVSQAERIAQGEHDEWAQRKWFDLYLEAAEALDTLDYFRAKYPNAEYKQGTEERAKDWNEMMLKVRAVGRTAFVFPKNPIVTAFIASCKFKDSESAVSDDRFKEMFEALEGLRAKALVNPSVLDYDSVRKP